MWKLTYNLILIFANRTSVTSTKRLFILSQNLCALLRFHALPFKTQAVPTLTLLVGDLSKHTQWYEKRAHNLTWKQPTMDRKLIPGTTTLPQPNNYSQNELPGMWISKQCGSPSTWHWLSAEGLSVIEGLGKMPETAYNTASKTVESLPLTQSEKILKITSLQ